MENSNSLYWNHLIDSKYYIQTWIYNAPWMKIPVSYVLEDAEYIDYYRANTRTADKNLEHSNHNSFVISKLNSSNKYSKDYLNCTWVVALGESKDSWENISFLTHQNVIWFLRDEQSVGDEFKEKLKASIDELKKKSKEWTVDIIILWWNDFDEYSDYKETIKFLDSVITESAWFSPSVVWWPTVNKFTWNKNSKDIALNTKERKVSLFKQYSEVSENINFVANKVDEILENL